VRARFQTGFGVAFLNHRNSYAPDRRNEDSPLLASGLVCLLIRGGSVLAKGDLVFVVVGALGEANVALALGAA